MLAYDGRDHDVIVVSAGVTSTEVTRSIEELTVIALPGAAQGAAVRYPEPPLNVGDAWITLGAALEPYGLQTTNVYRHTIEAAGTVTLQAPVAPLTACG